MSEKIIQEILNFVNVEEAKKLYGEPEYGYFKQMQKFSPKRRGQDAHHSSSFGWEKCSQEEFERELQQGEDLEYTRFYGGSGGKNGVSRSYYTYQRRLTKAGWVEVLIGKLKKLNEEIYIPKGGVK